MATNANSFKPEGPPPLFKLFIVPPNGPFFFQKTYMGKLRPKFGRHPRRPGFAKSPHSPLSQINSAALGILGGFVRLPIAQKILLGPRHPPAKYEGIPENDQNNQWVCFG